MADENWVGQIGKELERIFRYLLPGIIVYRIRHGSSGCIRTARSTSFC